MGLNGTELRSFIKEQQDLEREERNQQREHDRTEQDKQRESEKELREKSEDEEGEDNKESSVASGHTRQRIGAKGPKMPCLMRELMIWIHSCIDLRYMQIAKDGAKDSGQYICQHF